MPTRDVPQLPVAVEPFAFGKYIVLAKLARGGMGEIFLALLEGAAGFRKEVVVKRILPAFADNPTIIAMLLDEARISARITHPNVCQVYELGQHLGTYFIAMEYLDGVPFPSLRRAYSLSGQPFDIRLLVGLIAQAAEGLHYAHELKGPDGKPLNVVHRDVSPHNLFVTIDGMVKVLDFGIAKIANPSVHTRTGALKGKYLYMSPEQVRNQALDRRSDVFTLGICAAELLTGVKLFYRENDLATFKAITDDPIPPMRDFRPDLPDEISLVIEKALARDPGDRYPTIRAFGDALRTAAETIGGAMSAPAIADTVNQLCAEELDARRAVVSRALALSEGLSAQTLSGDRDLSTEDGEETKWARPRSSTGTTPPPTPSDASPSHASQSGVLLSDFSATGARRTGAGTGTGMRLPGSRTTPPVGLPARPTTPPPIPGTRPPLPGRAPTGSRSVTAPPIGRPTATPAVRPAMGYSATRPPSSDPGVYALSGTTLPIPDKPWRAKVAIAGGGVVAIALVLFFALRSGAPPAGTVATTTAPSSATAPVAAPMPRAASAAPPESILVEQLPSQQTEPPPVAPTEMPRPQPTPRKASSASSVSREPGFFTIDSSPYATVSIAGKRIGETPLFRVPLRPGKHRVKAQVQSGQTQTFTIEIEPGKDAPAKRLKW